MQLSLDTGFSHLDFLSVDIVGSDFNWSSRTTIKAFLAVIALLLVIWSYTPTFMGITAPYAGYSSNLVPGAWVRFQFTKGARDIVDSGYKHVRP